MNIKNMKWIVFSLGLFALPLTASASWWNPGTWFENAPSIVSTPKSVQAATSTPSQIVYIPVQSTSTSQCTPQVIIKTISVSDPSQQTLIQNLQSEVASLESQLAQPSKQSTIPPVIETISSNDSQVKALKSELASLDEILSLINNYNTSTDPNKMQDLLSAMDSVVDINGNRVFNDESFLPASATQDQNGNFLSIPGFPIVSSKIENIENNINLQLEAAEANQ
jgi:hypothetical protein